MASTGRARGAASEAADAAGRAKDTAQDAAVKAERSRAATWVERVGQVANGVVHLIIGMLAFGVAFGAGGSADQSGAMRAIQQTPLGGIALWAVGIALIALALHAAVTAVAVSRRDAKEALKAAGRGIAYAVVGSTALVYAVGGSSDGEESTESLSGELMASPWGLWLVGLIGLVIAAVGISFVVKGARRGFREDVAPPRRFRRLVDLAGTAGYVMKGLAVVVVGGLFVTAAFTHDAEQAGGLDGALQSLTTVPGGVFALIAIAVGLLLYGLYCFARSAWPR
ncbi:DUF1206 domain-containing protein [Agrococcus baldri]|uniref:DUF1206 domain-containing protein n=1 Tax=Agrococcus baldri TaxID=153730 RepID=A0AA87RGC1_9MICO|nr:DUF1206 domain-containing protein [Agrococcus baldri]GEK79946.1 hypothetical protein ABA31_12970 [Agrococcus baldri]